MAAKGAPIACSLEGRDLQHRLQEVAEVGAESLIARKTDGGRHLLLFRPAEGTRPRLEAIIAAEEKCCPFLDCSLEDRGDALILSISASEEGRPVADGLAAAFAGRGSKG